MHLLEYQNIYKNEEKHFYYVGIQREIISLLKNILEYNASGVNLKILDAGCGTGFLTKELECFGDVQGVDISAEAVRLTRDRGVKVVQASIDKLPFKDNLFDLIVSVDVLYHQDVNEKKALKELHRVLKPGGILILKLPAFDFLKGKHDIVVQTVRRYTKGSLLARLSEVGFKETRSTYIAISLFLPALIKRSAERFFGLNEKEAESDLKMPPQIINRLLVLLFNAENFLLKYMDLPFGLSVLAIAKKKVKDNTE